MKYRTDLAVERREMLEEAGEREGDLDGIVMEKESYGDGVSATRIRITNEEGSEKMGKPMGSYVTIEAAGVLEEDDGIKERTENAVSRELSRLIDFDYFLRVLIAGLGNSAVTPDSLGPQTASKIKITRHLFVMFEADGDDEMSNVSCIVPGVTAATGMESADMIRKMAEICRPDVVIVIDSLAARNIERVSTTIQITDTGISPGGGMGNHRKGIDENYISATYPDGHVQTLFTPLSPFETPETLHSPI